MKAARFALVLALLTLCVAGMAAAQTYNYPTVGFSFDESTFTYTYTVTVTPQDSFPLAYLEVDTKVANSGITAWTQMGPVAGAVDYNWSTDYFNWGSGDAAVWFADILKNQAEVDPKQLNGNWVGVFTLVVPNSQPDPDGLSLTMGGSLRSQQDHVVTVPGPMSIVPEPSSLLALGAGLVGMGGFCFRRRNI